VSVTDGALFEQRDDVRPFLVCVHFVSKVSESNADLPNRCEQVRA